MDCLIAGSSEADALGEHDVADAAVEAGEEVAGVVLVEEVVEGHGELDEGAVVVDDVEGEGEVEAQAFGEHGLLGIGIGAAGGAVGADGHVVVDARLDGGFLASEDESRPRLEIEGPQVVVIGLEDKLLALVEGTEIEAYGCGCPRGVDAHREVAHMLEGGAEGVVVWSPDVVGVGEAGFLYAHGEDKVAVGDDALEGLGVPVVFIAFGKDDDGAAGGLVDEHRPVVGAPTACIEGPGTLCRNGCDGHKCHNDKG